MNGKIKVNHTVILIIAISSTVLFTNINNNIYAIKYDPVPFDEIPLAIINSEDDEYEFGADYSLDFGDETAIIHDNNAESTSNMKLDKDDNSLSLEVECDSNDECDKSLSPEHITIYLVDKDIKDKQIVNNVIPVLELEKNDCGSQSLEDCADFDFEIPNKILTQKYKIVIEMDFDEAEWFFINPVKITK